MLSVVVPAHNEQDYLESAVVDLVKGLRGRDQPFEIIVCENGSTDATAALAEDLSTRFDEVRWLSADRPDYGVALRAGFLAAAGEVVANFDVDYVDLGFLDAALDLLAHPAGPDAVLASKRRHGAQDTRAGGRRLVTATFSLVLHIGFGLQVSDTHGMKVLRRDRFLPIVEQCRFGSDLFDTELILRGERAGLRVGEIGVTVRDTRPPRTPITRRIPRSLAGLAKLRIVLWQERLGRRGGGVG
ncbi:MAG TPA: glycosyltransferase family 2 protein [Acidimicrobiales bacterium]|nr:glycosyltransferase family 2 protein [Acidimicrobiales bacterium]